MLIASLTESLTITGQAFDAITILNKLVNLYRCRILTAEFQFKHFFVHHSQVKIIGKDDIMKYDPVFGELIKQFFSQLSSALSAEAGYK